jgi:hypothetical protein
VLAHQNLCELRTLLPHHRPHRYRNTTASSQRVASGCILPHFLLPLFLHFHHHHIRGSAASTLTELSTQALCLAHACRRNQLELRNHGRAVLGSRHCKYLLMRRKFGRRTLRQGVRARLQGRRPVSPGRLQCFKVQFREANFDSLSAWLIATSSGLKRFSRYLTTGVGLRLAWSYTALHGNSYSLMTLCFVMFTSPTLWPLLPLLYRPILV